MRADKFEVALTQLQARRVANKKSNGRTPPNPNAPASDKPQAQQTPFDYEKALADYRDAVNAATSEDKLDEIYNRLIGRLMGTGTPQDFFDEAKAIDDERRALFQNG
jgi:hypothetical protein